MTAPHEVQHVATEMRDRALTVPCPPRYEGCGAAAGEPCTRMYPKPGDPPVVHWPRQMAAHQAARDGGAL